MHDNHQIANKSGIISTYVAGFGLSIILTLASYFIVTENLVKTNLQSPIIMGLALLQALIQLVFFLHLGSESKPRWNLITFFFMLFVLAIVIIGSYWIMTDLDSRMM